MPSNLLKFSTLLILSQFVFSSEQFQTCLGTAKSRSGEDYTFALAQVDDYINPLGSQEACYYSCGAQVVTQSANRGDMTGLTLMDKAATFLTASGFLKVGKSYFVNHLGLEDVEGGNGIGCIEIKPGNKLNHYPKSNSVCSMAKAAICGFWGQQFIPAQPSGVRQLPSPSIATTTAKILPPITIIPPVETRSTRRRNHPKKTPTANNPPAVKTIPISTTSAVIVETFSSSVPAATSSVPEPSSPLLELTEVFPEIEMISNILPIPDEPLPLPVGLPIEIFDPSPDMKFKVNGRGFHVISKYATSLASAGVTCQQNKANIATITSENYSAVANGLKGMGQDKFIIGSWNGDKYFFTGNKCLILQVNHGIFPGICADVPAILCQSL